MYEKSKRDFFFINFKYLVTKKDFNNISKNINIFFLQKSVRIKIISNQLLFLY